MPSQRVPVISGAKKTGQPYSIKEMDHVAHRLAHQLVLWSDHCNEPMFCYDHVAHRLAHQLVLWSDHCNEPMFCYDHVAHRLAHQLVLWSDHCNEPMSSVSDPTRLWSA
uniref:Uncharacterized protein n=1 Tax=Timema poppense TaxID=170557 RepID=A0A7R9CS53_TIMPO|nr:unnamed protein product [Timema poppensis]